MKNRFSNLKLNQKFTLIIIVSILIPITIFASIIFYRQEQDIIATNQANISYKRAQNASNIKNCIDSINMTTQFFLADEQMKSVLIKAMDGITLSTDELVQFQEGDIINLERLVSNNPLLYSVRIFAENNNVQEMMPILYKLKRMERLEWTSDVSQVGWHYNYKDAAFSNLLTNQNDNLVCLVSEIKDYRKGKLGVVEASMKMQTMFPSIYEGLENELSCFVTENRFIYAEGTDEAKWAEVLQLITEKTVMPDEEAVYQKWKGHHYIIASLKEEKLNGELLFIRDISEEIEHVHDARTLFVLMMVFVIFLLAYLINLIVNRMLRQFYSILRSIRDVQSGNLDVRIEHCSNDEMGELGTQLNTMLDRISQLMDDSIKREILVKDSEIRALQNQINAHFIYNVLESIKMMAEIDEEYEISDSITSLGKLLRYSMRWVSGNVSVAEELDYIRNYMALINLRYDFVVNLSVNMPENILEQEIPKMSLQPIVENAILHGIEPLGVDSTIYIKGISDGKNCIIEVTDTGKGMSEEERLSLEQRIVSENPEAKEKSNGIGLHNVQHRIQMAFGESYGMRISAVKDCYTKISICLPFKKHGG